MDFYLKPHQNLEHSHCQMHEAVPGSAIAAQNFGRNEIPSVNRNSELTIAAAEVCQLTQG